MLLSTFRFVDAQEPIVIRDTLGLTKEYYPLANGSYKIKEYNADNILLLIGHLRSLNPDIREGAFIFFDSLGRAIVIGEYLNNIPRGKWKYVDQDKNTFTELDYDNVIELLIHDTIIEKDVVLICQHMPTFNGGGMNEFLDYMNKNKVYPIYAKMHNITGTVFANFIINKEGQIISPKIIREGSFVDLNMEVLRLLVECNDWSPGYQKRNNFVNISISVAIKFQ